MYELHWPSFSFFKEVDGYIVSAVEKMKKPDLRIYNLICQRYQFNPEECLFVDDRQVNIEAARQAGMNAVLFEDYNQFNSAFKLYTKDC